MATDQKVGGSNPLAHGLEPAGTSDKDVPAEILSKEGSMTIYEKAVELWRRKNVQTDARLLEALNSSRAKNSGSGSILSCQI